MQVTIGNTQNEAHRHLVRLLRNLYSTSKGNGVMPLWAAAILLLRVVRWHQYVCTHFPIHFTNFLYFTVSAASTSLFRTGGHFPAVGDRLRQAPLAETVRGDRFRRGTHICVTRESLCAFATYPCIIRYIRYITCRENGGTLGDDVVFLARSCGVSVRPSADHFSCDL